MGNATSGCLLDHKVDMKRRPDIERIDSSSAPHTAWESASS